MKTFQQTIETLTTEQKQLLATTLINCECGSCDFELKDDDGNWECHPCVYFNTKGVSELTTFTPRKVSAMFRTIYKKIEGNGSPINHFNNWLEDGTMNALFVGDAVYNEAIEWAKNF